MEDEKKLETLYMELGKAYYEGRFEDPLPELLPYFDAITKLRTPQDDNVFCPNCGSKIKPGATFCGNCGYHLK